MKLDIFNKKALGMYKEQIDHEKEKNNKLEKKLKKLEDVHEEVVKDAEKWRSIAKVREVDLNDEIAKNKNNERIIDNIRSYAASLEIKANKAKNVNKEIDKCIKYASRTKSGRIRSKNVRRIQKVAKEGAKHE